jgi:polyisoprenoid-binding protein YceI
MSIVTGIWEKLLWAGFACAATATATAGQLEIDPLKSRIEVAVSCTVDSFVGHLEKYQAVIEGDEKAAMPPKASVSFNFADLKTGKADRDAAMLKWLEFEVHPAASFTLTGWQQNGTTNLALGRLTLHGVTVDLQMPVVVKQADGIWTISGQANFDYRDFKLEKIRKALLLTVDPKLKVKFQLVGKLPKAKQP